MVTMTGRSDLMAFGSPLTTSERLLDETVRLGDRPGAPHAGGWQFSIGVRRQSHVRAAIEQIDEPRERPCSTTRPRASPKSPRPRSAAAGPSSPAAPPPSARASGRFFANPAWTVIAALAHNLLRWPGVLGLPHRTSAPPAACAGDSSPCPAG